MKTNAIIPIFIPHMGCAFDCIFCNQGQITARGNPVSKTAIVENIESLLATIEKKGLSNIEIAFYGGSFTGLSVSLQREYLSIAKKYKDDGRVNGIRLSTRPDYIDEAILSNLKAYGVDLIELGVQSFDDEVLLASQRGHSSAIVYQSSKLIKSYGFKLGIQLMIGLPGDTYEKSINSAIQTTIIAPAIARIYPTIIIKDTGLESLFLSGKYLPLELDEAVRTAKDMYLILKGAGINVIRMGLKSSDNIADGKSILGDTFHPAFRQIVESAVAREALEKQLLEKSQILNLISADQAAGNGLLSTYICDEKNLHSIYTNGEKNIHSADTSDENPNLSSCDFTFYSKKESLSNMIGNRGSNRIYFQNKYPNVRFTFKIDNTLEIGEYVVQCK